MINIIELLIIVDIRAKIMACEENKSAQINLYSDATRAVKLTALVAVIVYSCVSFSKFNYSSALSASSAEIFDWAVFTLPSATALRLPKMLTVPCKTK